MSLQTLVFALLLSTIQVFSQTTHEIDDPEDLTAAFSATLGAGDTVILTDGIYDSDSRVKFSPSTGTAAMPITLRPQTPGGVKFTGGLKMSIGGDYVIVDGFHWEGGYGASNFIEFRDGSDYANHSTIQNCAINGLEVDPDDIDEDTSVKHNWIVLYGTYNTIINCSFMNKETSGNMILAELSYNAENSCDEVGHTISNNYFYKYAKIDAELTNSGDSETIRIGTSSNQNVNSNTTVFNNYFVEADGENEIITNKSKGNIYTNNTFRRCRGSLVLRHGSHATVDGNFFLGEDVDGTGGIRIVDSDHTITNNYIQDCVAVNADGIWNNGITFLGGSANNAVLCTTSSTSNGYQKALNNNLSNNTIINTNAPLFFNVNTGTNNVTGTVSNNLIYFANGDPNMTPVISGNTATAYTDFGTALTYTGNVYTGTTLGVTNTGFAEDNGIMATADGEIFTFTGAAGKGADMGSYMPTTDAMVGDGIGACFLDYLGQPIANPTCTIVIGETLIVGNLTTLSADADSYDVSVTANVGWTAVSNDAWITITPSSGTGDETVSVAVTANTETTERIGTVTFSQVPGGDDIVRTLYVTQTGADLTDLFNLINTGEANDPVEVHSFSQEEVDLNADPPKTNYAVNTLDKNTGTQWTAGDGAIVSGDYKGDGEYVIYDLNGEYNLDLIQIATDDKVDPYGLQIWVSTTGTEAADFTKVLPATGDILITTTTGTREDFDQYELSASARYIKLLAFGRFNAAGTARVSAWTNITEIEFFGTETLSIDEADLRNQILIYPVPAKDILHIKSINSQIDVIQVYSLDGRKLIENRFNAVSQEVSLDTSSLVNGTYIVNVSNNNQVISKMIVVSK